MKRLLALLVLAACDSSSTADAGLDVDVGLQCDGGCDLTLDDYCKVNPCAANATAAVAQLCANNQAFLGIKVYSGCGYTIVIGNGKDTSEENVFGPDGALLALYHSSPFGTCCTAGPLGFHAPNIQGCVLAQPTCDAGTLDASDAEADAGAE